MNDKIILPKLENPFASELYLKYGESMEVKRTATKGELVAMMAALIEIDEVFKDAFFELAKMTNQHKQDL